MSELRLVLYSGGDFRENAPLNRELIRLTGKRKPRITYIPSASDWGRWEFGEFVDEFQRLGLARFLYFPVDTPFTPALCREALSSDAIFLSGGNTFSFLQHLRRTGVLEQLREFALAGGVLSGLSAGAILQTPTIGCAGFPPFDRDENAVGLKNLEALGLVDFEFFPHFSNSPRYREAVSRYAHARKVTVLACPDASGVVVEGARTRIIGRAMAFSGRTHHWVKP